MVDLSIKREYKNLLFDFYGGMLTDKQRQVYEMYYEDDYSMTEIGEILGVSSQSVADMLKRTDTKMDKYEENIGLISKLREHRKIAANIEAELNKIYEAEQGNDNRLSVTRIRIALDKLIL